MINVEQQGGQSQGAQPRSLTGTLKGNEMPSISAGPPHRAQVVNVAVSADEAHLQAAVPLLPQKARTKVPLLLHAAQVSTCSLLSSVFPCNPFSGWMHVRHNLPLLQVASYTGDEEARLDVRLEYASSVDEASREDTIGRRITLPIHLRFLPSLQVSCQKSSSAVHYQWVRYKWRTLSTPVAGGVSGFP